MAVSYESKSKAPNPDARKTDFLYQAACAIQPYIEEASCGSYIICVRFGGGGIDGVIHCSCHADEEAARNALRNVEPPPNQKLVDYMLGTREDFVDALTWPA